MPSLTEILVSPLYSVLSNYLEFLLLLFSVIPFLCDIPVHLCISGIAKFVSSADSMRTFLQVLIAYLPVLLMFAVQLSPGLCHIQLPFSNSAALLKATFNKCVAWCLFHSIQNLQIRVLSVCSSINRKTLQTLMDTLGVN